MSLKQLSSVLIVLQIWAGHVWAGCWVEAGKRYSIEPELLYAIADVESKLNARALNRNNDGSRDVGLMQINSLHFPRLATRGITEQQLLEDTCLAIDVGASILAEFIARHGYNWTAVGAYNAGSAPARQALRLRYARKVWQRYQALLSDESIVSKF